MRPHSAFVGTVAVAVLSALCVTGSASVRDEESLGLNPRLLHDAQQAPLKSDCFAPLCLHLP